MVQILHGRAITTAPVRRAIQHSQAFGIYAECGCAATVGPGCAFTGRVNLDIRERRRFEIGRDCLFASGVTLMTSDMHSVVDVATGTRLNPAKDIVIGDHVWIGGDVTVLKGVALGRDCVVGRGSTVTNRRQEVRRLLAVRRGSCDLA